LWVQKYNLFSYNRPFSTTFFLFNIQYIENQFLRKIREIALI